MTRPAMLRILLIAAAVAAPISPAAAKDADRRTPAPPNKPASRWEKHIKRFEAADKKAPPPKGAVLFLGSSSIVRWNTQKLFPHHTTINRGFGGSQIADSLQYVDRILIPYAPRLVVFYAGDNDIAAKKTPEQVLADYKALVAKVHVKLPQTRFIFVAIKPSISRWRLWKQMEQANRLIADFGRHDRRLVFLDIAKPMLGPDGKVKRTLLVSDGLHLSKEGYALWTSLVTPLLGPPETPVKPEKPSTEAPPDKA